MLGQMLLRAGPAAAGPLLGSCTTWPRSPMSSTGHHDLDLERLADAGVDDGDGAGPAGASQTAEEAGHLLQRALRGRQPDPLRRPLAQGVEPLQAERQVGAPLGGGEGVDLVDDDGLDTAQRLPRVRREHEVEALGRGDQQVGRVAHERLALPRGGVAGAQADRGLGVGQPEAFGGQPDAGQRRAEVLLDVEGQGPQRRQVEEAGPALLGLGRRRRTRAGRCPTGRRPASCRSPVGAQMRVCWPAAMAGQPSAWAAVGSGNAAANHSRTAGENRSRSMGISLRTGCHRVVRDRAIGGRARPLGEAKPAPVSIDVTQPRSIVTQPRAIPPAT